jgi:hypothetical protein
MRRYAVIYEKAASNWGAYVPDLPGGEPVPPPSAEVDFVKLETAAF